ncbi:MAG: YegS/Rv2252/BmrU family lipid kinase [Lachnospiraceae bacterium]|nr:YegS/Rv2252/BmrU family lipid kinase [Lachnospiraceae bacterium]
MKEIKKADKKLLFISNPRAGQKKKEGFLVDVINEFEDGGYTTELHYTRRQGDAVRIVSQYGTSADMIVCMGGDGTLNEVIEAVLKAGMECPIGYIPAGSTNDFANSLGLESQPEKAAKNIMKKNPHKLDIGCFNGRNFVYTASCGIFASTSYETSQDIKNVIGHSAYILQGIMDLTKIKQMNLTFEYDGKVESGTYIFAAICNATKIGGIMSIDKDVVDFRDGKFELLLVKYPKDLIELGVTINNLQNQIYGEGVQLISVSDLKIKNAEGIDWSLDGEKEEAKSEVEFKVIPEAVNFIY